MLFEFIDIAYSCTILLLVFGTFFVDHLRKKIILNLIAVSNVLLIFYSWYLLYQFYKLLQFASLLPIKVDKSNSPKIVFGWFEIRFLLLIILPYLFLFKKLMANKFLSVLFFVIIQWGLLQSCYFSLTENHTLPQILFYAPYHIEFKILNYICLFTAVYALLWMYKKLPGQQALS